MQNKEPFTKLAQLMRKEWKKVPSRISVIAADEFDKNFERQGFKNSAGVIQWKKRSAPQFGKQRSLLIKSGRLRRSITPQPRDGAAGVIANAPHAQLHNRGGVLKVTPKMRKFFRAMYFKEAGKIKGNMLQGVGNQRKATMAGYWLMLSRAKKITIPKRQFMGHSAHLYKLIQTDIRENFLKPIWQQVNS